MPEEVSPLEDPPEEELEEEVTQETEEGSIPTKQLPIPDAGQQARLKLLQATIPSGIPVAVQD